MLLKIKVTIQIATIICFAILTIIGLIEKDWNFDAGLNLSLTFLYIFLYLQPFKS